MRTVTVSPVVASPSSLSRMTCSSSASSSGRTTSGSCRRSGRGWRPRRPDAVDVGAVVAHRLGEGLGDRGVAAVGAFGGPSARSATTASMMVWPGGRPVDLVAQVGQRLRR